MDPHLVNLNSTHHIDLPLLIDTRLLVQANSGGGKSWLLRRLLEQSHGKVQQLVIDLEGEFSSLRERFDYVLAGKGGDTPADPTSAGLLARKLLELNVSAIIDLYELHYDERKRFVRLFLEAMINAPKELWHPCLVVLDEAHVFCPERGQSEAAAAVIDLATRGRKRGYCAVLATQRLAKLHKDAAAECNNKLIGRCSIDVDMKRASEELGFGSREQYLSLRSLEPGEFFAFGPALSPAVRKVTVGPVGTAHPKAGSRILTAAPAPPTPKIRAILQQLADLPQAAVEEAATVERLEREMRSLRRQLRDTPPQAPTAAIAAAIKRALADQANGFDDERARWAAERRRLESVVAGVRQALDGGGTSTPPSGEPPSPDALPSQARPPDNELVAMWRSKLGDGPRRIFDVLVERHPLSFTRAQLALLSKYAVGGGQYRSNLGLLVSNGLVSHQDGRFKASDELFALSRGAAA